MSRKRKPHQETLKPSLCRGRLQTTTDGLWYTNGHWLARAIICKITKSTPELGESQPDPSVLRLPPTNEYREARIRTELTLQGWHPVVVEDEIVTWIDPQYAEAWNRGCVYAAGVLDPILFGGRTLDEAYAAVMPARVELSKNEAQILHAWLAKQ